MSTTNNDVKFSLEKVLASIQLDLKHPAEASKHIEQALKLKENSSSCLVFGGKLKEQTGDLSGALSDFDLALNSDKTHLNAILAKMNILLKMKKEDESIQTALEGLESLEQAKFDSDKFPILTQLSSLYEIKGNMDSALQAIDQAILLRPNDNSLVSKREELEQLSISADESSHLDSTMEETSKFDFEDLFWR